MRPALLDPTRAGEPAFPGRHRASDAAGLLPASRAPSPPAPTDAALKRSHTSHRAERALCPVGQTREAWRRPHNTKVCCGRAAETSPLIAPVPGPSPPIQAHTPSPASQRSHAPWAWKSGYRRGHSLHSCTDTGPLGSGVPGPPSLLSTHGGYSPQRCSLGTQGQGWGCGPSVPSGGDGDKSGCGCAPGPPLSTLVASTEVLPHRCGPRTGRPGGTCIRGRRCGFQWQPGLRRG